MTAPLTLREQHRGGDALRWRREELAELRDQAIVDRIALLRTREHQLGHLTFRVDTKQVPHGGDPTAPADSRKNQRGE